MLTKRQFIRGKARTELCKVFEHVSSTCTDVLRIFSFCGVGKQIGRVESAYLYRAGFPRARSDPSSKKFWVADQAAKFIRLMFGIHSLRLGL